MFIRRHGLRNVMLPFLTLQLGSISELFGGSVLAETVFTYPGLGNATVQSALRGDIPLFIGIALFSSVFVFGGNLSCQCLFGQVITYGLVATYYYSTFLVEVLYRLTAHNMQQNISCDFIKRLLQRWRNCAVIRWRIIGDHLEN